LSKMKVSLNFAKAAKDSVSMRGALRVPAGFEPSGQQVTVNVGGAATSFTLNTKGAASIGANSVKIKIKSKGGVVEEQDAPITMSFKKGDFASSLADDGLINADRSAAPVGVQVFVSLADKLYHAVAPLTYSAKQDKAGKAK